MAIISFKFMFWVVMMMLVYFLAPRKIKWYVLLIGSYIYYFIASSKLTIFLIVTTITVYWSAILLNKVDEKRQINCKDKEIKKILKKEAERKKKIIIFITIFINIGILLILKYGNFIGKNVNEIMSFLKIDARVPLKKVVLPLGISYYTLQAIGYIVDVYRGRYKAEKNWGKVALFLSFFPQMLEGPIGRYEQLTTQLCEPHDFDYKRVKYAIQMILWGIFKKMVIADRAALYVNEVFDKYNEYSGIIIVMAIMLYTIQIYAEFSGCIDIVRGVAQIFGIELAENFKRPFFSKSVQEFWRRWHITLGEWLKEYIFYPISFSKITISLTSNVKKIFKGYIGKLIPAMFALFFVWFTNGIWHGASWKYIFYGLYYYTIMVIGMTLTPIFKHVIAKLKINTKTCGYKMWQMARTTAIVLIGMLIFRAKRLKIALQMFLSIFTFENIGKLFNGELFEIGFKTSDFLVVVVGVIIMFIVGLMQEKGYSIRERINRQNIFLRWTLYYGIIFSIIIFGIYGKGYSASNFIYGQF